MLQAGYEWNQIKVRGTGGRTYRRAAIPVEAAFHFNRQFSVIGEAMFETKNDKDQEKVNQYGVIVRYKF